jgi:uncharacterized protein (DUF697 family)
MYVRINKAVGLSFGDNVLKSIASGVLANLASVIPGLAMAAAAETVLKFVPGFGTAAGIAMGAVTNVAILYVAGRVYLKSLEVLINNNKSLTAENIEAATKEAASNKDFVKAAYAKGKAIAKDAKQK